MLNMVCLISAPLSFSILPFSSSFPGLSEWYSPLTPGTGLHPRPYSASTLKTYFEEIDPTTWSSIYYPTRKGEDVEQVHERATTVLSDLISEVETRFTEANHKRVLLVSHAATVIALARELAGDKEMPMRVGCCTLSEFRRKDGGGWDMKKKAEGEFLTGGVQRDWGLEDIRIANGKVSCVFVFLNLFDPHMMLFSRSSMMLVFPVRNARRMILLDLCCGVDKAPHISQAVFRALPAHI